MLSSTHSLSRSTRKPALGRTMGGWFSKLSRRSTTHTKLMLIHADTHTHHYKVCALKVLCMLGCSDHTPKDWTRSISAQRTNLWCQMKTDLHLSGLSKFSHIWKWAACFTAVIWWANHSPYAGIFSTTVPLWMPAHEAAYKYLIQSSTHSPKIKASKHSQTTSSFKIMSANFFPSIYQMFLGAFLPIFTSSLSSSSLCAFAFVYHCFLYETNLFCKYTPRPHCLVAIWGQARSPLWPGTGWESGAAGQASGSGARWTMFANSTEHREETKRRVGGFISVVLRAEGAEMMCGQHHGWNHWSVWLDFLNSRWMITTKQIVPVLCCSFVNKTLTWIAYVTCVYNIPPLLMHADTVAKILETGLSVSVCCYLCELLWGCGQYRNSAVQFGKELVCQMSQAGPARPLHNHP